ncbi:hypothetical protein K1T73_01185 [Roseovarius sp. SCSIO 43702]|uniref:hypothetical protein n=1 Tax=Roseovarius sp. SCSIO 43702 TaxID=2823043 RepID=UPI001C732577|nr:hypothetical protein [Roseovarius sp. SCSIO 43702]QYX57061.1 hypothetical protein K1T73_01185 [Roseovarius sp. SCSIO 43702]
MIRGEVTVRLRRWRDVLAGAGIAAAGFWAALTSYGILGWIGWIVVAVGCLLIWTGFQRHRFETSRDGPGVVHITEGQVSYYGPLTGGTVARSNLQSVEHDARHRPAHWVLVQREGPALYIPVTASGSDALFDFFSSLPGLRIEEVLRVLKSSDQSKTCLWQRKPDRDRGRIASS